jgi:indole-3-glycerol phosphate synthase
MDMGLFERLRALIPSHIVTVAESGILDAQDANRMRDAGADAILVGELLATSANPRLELERLLGRSRTEGV